MLKNLHILIITTIITLNLFCSEAPKNVTIRKIVGENYTCYIYDCPTSTTKAERFLKKQNNTLFYYYTAQINIYNKGTFQQTEDKSKECFNGLKGNFSHLAEKSEVSSQVIIEGISGTCSCKTRKS